MKSYNIILNIVVVFLSLIVSIYLCEILITHLYQKKNYPSLNQINKYINLGKDNHHIRDLDSQLIEDNLQYYSVYHGELNDNKAVVFQGDSWAEITDRKSDVLKNLMLKKTNIFINGGTSSYSPSLMEIQFNDIIKETKYEIETLIVYIDQTDFMDEVCDYSKKRVEVDGKLISVRKPSGFIHERYSPNYQYEKFNSGIPKLIFFIENKFYQYVHKKMIKKSPTYCKWDEISKFMKKKTTISDEKIFYNSMKSYLMTVTNFAQKVVLVTHKHRKHYENEYGNDIYFVLLNIIDKLNLKNKVKIVDISPKTIENLNDVFPTDEVDKASHPHMIYYDKVFSQKIYNLLE